MAPRRSVKISTPEKSVKVVPRKIADRRQTRTNSLKVPSAITISIPITNTNLDVPDAQRRVDVNTKIALADEVARSQILKKPIEVRPTPAPKTRGRKKEIVSEFFNTADGATDNKVELTKPTPSPVAKINKKPAKNPPAVKRVLTRKRAADTNHQKPKIKRQKVTTVQAIASKEDETEEKVELHLEQKDGLKEKVELNQEQKDQTTSIEDATETKPDRECTFTPPTNPAGTRKKKLSLRGKRGNAVDKTSPPIHKARNVKRAKTQSPCNESPKLSQAPNIEMPKSPVTCVVLPSTPPPCPKSTKKQTDVPKVHNAGAVDSRKTSISSASYLSWTRDISSTTTCLTASSNDVVRINKKMPVIKLTNIDSQVEKYMVNHNPSSTDSETSCDRRTSPVQYDSPVRVNSLNLSSSSRNSVVTQIEEEDLIPTDFGKSAQNLANTLKKIDIEFINWIQATDYGNSNLNRIKGTLFEILRNEFCALIHCRNLQDISNTKVVSIMHGDEMSIINKSDNLVNQSVESKKSNTDERNSFENNKIITLECLRDEVKRVENNKNTSVQSGQHNNVESIAKNSVERKPNESNKNINLVRPNTVENNNSNAAERNKVVIIRSNIAERNKTGSNKRNTIDRNNKVEKNKSNFAGLNEVEGSTNNTTERKIIERNLEHKLTENNRGTTSERSGNETNKSKTPERIRIENYNHSTPDRSRINNYNSNSPPPRSGIENHKCNTPPACSGIENYRCNSPPARSGIENYRCTSPPARSGIENNKCNSPPARSGIENYRCTSPPARSGIENNKCNSPPARSGIENYRCTSPPARSGIENNKCNSPPARSGIENYRCTSPPARSGIENNKSNSPPACSGVENYRCNSPPACSGIENYECNSPPARSGIENYKINSTPPRAPEFGRIGMTSNRMNSVTTDRYNFFKINKFENIRIRINDVGTKTIECNPVDNETDRGEKETVKSNSVESNTVKSNGIESQTEKEIITPSTSGTVPSKSNDSCRSSEDSSSDEEDFTKDVQVNSFCERPHDDDDDALSLYAESITGIESSRINNSVLSTPNEKRIEEYVPEPVLVNSALPKSYTYCPTKISEQLKNGVVKTVCEKQNADSTSIYKDKDANYVPPIYEKPPSFSDSAESNLQFIEKSERFLRTGLNTPNYPNKRPYIADLCKLKPKQWNRIFQGYCFFNLIRRCNYGTMFSLPCQNSHNIPTEVEIKTKLRLLSEEDIIKEYLLVRRWPRLLTMFGLCFIYESVRRQLTRVLVEMAFDFITKDENSIQNDSHKITAVEMTLLHLNTADLCVCEDLLKLKTGDGSLLCDVFMQVLTCTQNFSRFKSVFLNLTYFMVNNDRTFCVEVAEQILERVCILPFDESLVRAVIQIMRMTSPEIFLNSMIEHFEKQIANTVVMEEYLSLKREVDFEAVARSVVQRPPMQMVDQSPAVHPEQPSLAQLMDLPIPAPSMAQPLMIQTVLPPLGVQPGMREGVPLPPSPDTTHLDNMNKTAEDTMVPKITRTIRGLNSTSTSQVAGVSPSSSNSEQIVQTPNYKNWRHKSIFQQINRTNFSPSRQPMRPPMRLLRPPMRPQRQYNDRLVTFGGSHINFPPPGSEF